MKKILLLLLILTATFAEAQMTQIVVNSVNRYTTSGYAEANYKMRFTLPSQFGTGGSPIDGLNAIVSSYPKYGLEVIPGTGTVITYSDIQSFSASTTLASVKTFLQNQYTTIQSQINSFALSSYDSIAGLKYNGSVWGNVSTITDYPLSNDLNSAITATAASGSAVTLTIPAVNGKFHYITRISITAYSTAARTGTATPIIVTSTNLPGSMAWTFATAAAIGTTDIQPPLEPGISLRSLIANTATTIVCPATTGVIWRVTVLYNTTN